MNGPPDIPRMETVRYPLTNQWVGTMTCPKCAKTIAAWRSSGMSDCWPHFYCDTCSNAIQRDSDKAAVRQGQAIETVQRIAATLPACPCGGRFVPGANPKCPACQTEFAHQDDTVKRLSDPHVILIHGAQFFSDHRPAYRVEIGN